MPEDEIKKNSEVIDDESDDEELDIIHYLDYVLEFLKDADFKDVDSDDIEESLEPIEDGLAELRNFYRKPAPKGAKSARIAMLKIITGLEDVLVEIYEYMEEKDKEKIKSGIKTLEKADDMIDALAYTISQQRLELAELMEKIKKGEIIEGQKITSEERIPLNITDDSIEIEDAEVEKPALSLTDEDIENFYDTGKSSLNLMDEDQDFNPEAAQTGGLELAGKIWKGKKPVFLRKRRSSIAEAFGG